MSGHPRVRTVAIGSLFVIVAIIATALIVGGKNNTLTPAGVSRPNAVSDGATKVAIAHGSAGFSGGSGSTATTSSGGSGGGSSAGRGSINSAASPTLLAPLPAAAPQDAVGAASAGGTASSSTGDAGGGLAATRVVKTGNLGLTVAKGQVQTTISKLVTLTTGLGGYVSQSRTDDIDGSPTGSLTLRIPADTFESAVTSADKYGHQTSLVTSAHDVTGKYVDLNARLHALQSTRSTYLTILAKATTIGQTLSVQQRVEQVQEQIEQLQGQLKVLRNQSSYSTLTVDVTQVGSATTVPVHHKRHGLGLAWHKSISRFNRGIDAIVGALGPLLLALIFLGLIYVVGRLGMRRVKRATT